MIIIIVDIYSTLPCDQRVTVYKRYRRSNERLKKLITSSVRATLTKIQGIKRTLLGHRLAIALFIKHIISKDQDFLESKLQKKYTKNYKIHINCSPPGVQNGGFIIRHHNGRPIMEVLSEQIFFYDHFPKE